MSRFVTAKCPSLVGAALAVLPLAVLPLATAGAQQAAQTDSLPRISLFTRNDAYLGGFFVLSTIALGPFDRAIAGKLQQQSFQQRNALRKLAKGVETIAVPGSVVIGSTMYVVGRLTHQDKLADLGLHGEEAIGIANVINTAIKWTAGRARPYAVADTNARDYQLFRGYRKGRKYSSFPSGHSMAAFAAAAAVSNEASRMWPGSQWYVGPVMFGGATAVALARLYDNQHWATDVILGAGIGTFAGNKVVRFNHRTNRGNRVDRWLLTGSVQRTAGGGLHLAWSIMP